VLLRGQSRGMRLLDGVVLLTENGRCNGLLYGVALLREKSLGPGMAVGPGQDDRS